MSIRIESEGTMSKVLVDGVQLRNVTQIAFHVDGKGSPTVLVSLAAMEGDFEFADGVLKVQGVAVPEAVEKALLEYLCRKYPLTTEYQRSVGWLLNTAQS